MTKIISAKLFLAAPMLAVCVSWARAEGGTPKDLAAILAQLDNAEQWSEWKSANDALEHIGPDAVEGLRRYAADGAKDGRKRFMAFKAALKHLPNSQRRADLLRVFKNDPDPMFRTECARRMGKIGDDSFKVALRKAIDSPSEDGMVQVAAAEALAGMNDAYGKARALRAVLDGEPWSDFGIRALEKIGDAAVISEIEGKAWSDSRQIVKSACLMAALRLKIKKANEKERMRLLKESLEESGSLEVRQYSARALGEMGSAEASDTLRIAARRKDSSGRDAARDGFKVGIASKKWTSAQVKEWLKE